VHAVLGPLHAFVLLLPAIFGPHEAPPGGGTSAITLLAVQRATQLQCATSQTIALNGPYVSIVSYGEPAAAPLGSRRLENGRPRIRACFSRGAGQLLRGSTELN